MSQDSYRALIAADRILRQPLFEALTAAGFYAEEVTGSKEAIDALCARPFDLVLLDLGLPEKQGIDTCRRMRALAPDLGIVMIRSGGTPADDMLALDAGADDCIAAPFRFREIVARLGAVLRRNRVNDAKEATLLRAGDLELDTVRRRFRRAGHEIHLSRLEFDLLLFLMQNRETTLTHIKLLRGVWKKEFTYDPGYLRSYIKSLRAKIEKNPANPEYLLTERWVGYRFHDPSTALS